MKRYLVSLIGAGLLAPSMQAYAEDALEQRLQQAEARISQMERASHQEDRVSINGFLTWGADRTNTVRNEDGDALVYDDDVDTRWDHGRHTRAGVQLDARLTDQARGVVQLLSRADEDFSTEAQWAYLQYELTPSLSARAGRIVLPFYMHSQYTQVGFAYPWVELPREVYGVADLDTMEGLDLTWNTRTGPVTHEINVLLGSMDIESGGLPTFEVRDMHGINLRSQWGNWSTWLGYNNAWIDQDLTGVEVPDPPDGTQPADDNALDRNHSYFASGGIQYDDGTVLLMAERNLLSINSSTDWFPDRHGMYVMGGYRFGRWMPHLTWGHTYARGEPEVCGQDPSDSSCVLNAIYAEQQESWTLGLRYDLTGGIAIKAEASRYGHIDASGGLFSGVPDTSDPMVFRVSTDIVF